MTSCASWRRPSWPTKIRARRCRQRPWSMRLICVSSATRTTNDSTTAGTSFWQRPRPFFALSYVGAGVSPAMKKEHPMSPMREHVKTIFGQVAEMASPEERSRYLDEACGGEPVLRAEVEELLGAMEQAGDFL